LHDFSESDFDIDLQIVAVKHGIERVLSVSTWLFERAFKVIGPILPRAEKLLIHERIIFFVALFTTFLLAAFTFSDNFRVLTVFTFFFSVSIPVI
jgi:hypothetical protein